MSDQPEEASQLLTNVGDAGESVSAAPVAEEVEVDVAGAAAANEAANEAAANEAAAKDAAAKEAAAKEAAANEAAKEAAAKAAAAKAAADKEVEDKEKAATGDANVSVAIGAKEDPWNRVMMELGNSLFDEIRPTELAREYIKNLNEMTKKGIDEEGKVNEVAATASNSSVGKNKYVEALWMVLYAGTGEQRKNEIEAHFAQLDDSYSPTNKEILDAAIKANEAVEAKAAVEAKEGEAETEAVEAKGAWYTEKWRFSPIMSLLSEWLKKGNQLPEMKVGDVEQCKKLAEWLSFAYANEITQEQIYLYLSLITQKDTGGSGGIMAKYHYKKMQVKLLKQAESLKDDNETLELCVKGDASIEAWFLEPFANSFAHWKRTKVRIIEMNLGFIMQVGVLKGMPGVKLLRRAAAKVSDLFGLIRAFFTAVKKWATTVALGNVAEANDEAKRQLVTMRVILKKIVGQTNFRLTNLKQAYKLRRKLFESGAVSDKAEGVNLPKLMEIVDAAEEYGGSIYEKYDNAEVDQRMENWDKTHKYVKGGALNVVRAGVLEDARGLAAHLYFQRRYAHYTIEYEKRLAAEFKEKLPAIKGGGDPDELMRWLKRQEKERTEYIDKLKKLSKEAGVTTLSFTSVNKALKVATGVKNSASDAMTSLNQARIANSERRTSSKLVDKINKEQAKVTEDRNRNVVDFNPNLFEHESGFDSNPLLDATPPDPPAPGSAGGVFINPIEGSGPASPLLGASGGGRTRRTRRRARRTKRRTRRRTRGRTRRTKRRTRRTKRRTKRRTRRTRRTKRRTRRTKRRTRRTRRTKRRTRRTRRTRRYR